MTPRIEELQRQRALLLEHLRWLESEIASEAPSPDAAVLKSASLSATAPHPIPAVPPATMPPELAINVPEADTRSIRDDVRSGCLLYFALAFLTLGLVVGFIYLRY